MARSKAGKATEARILAATRELLGEAGLEGTTMAAIGERAGIGAGSFYNLFSSKEEVVLLVMREAIDAVDPDPAHAGTDTVADLADAYVRFITGEPLLARIYFRIAVGGALTDPALAGRVLRHHQRRVDRFAAALRREAPFSPDESVARAEAMLATLNGVALRWLLDPRFDLAGQAHRLLERERRGRPGSGAR